MLSGTSTCSARQRDRPLVDRQAVEARAVERREGFEPVERAFFVEHGRIGFERERRVEDAGAAARRFLGFDRVRRAVGAEEEFGRAGRRRLADREPVLLALGDRQAVSVGPKPAGEQGVAVDHQMLRRDRRRDSGRRGVRRSRAASCGRDMLEHDLAAAGKSLDQRAEDAVDEHRLAVEDVDVGIGDFAVDAAAPCRSPASAPAPDRCCGCR